MHGESRGQVWKCVVNVSGRNEWSLYLAAVGNGGTWVTITTCWYRVRASGRILRIMPAGIFAEFVHFPQDLLLGQCAEIADGMTIRSVDDRVLAIASAGVRPAAVTDQTDIAAKWKDVFVVQKLEIFNCIAES